MIHRTAPVFRLLLLTAVVIGLVACSGESSSDRGNGSGRGDGGGTYTGFTPPTAGENETPVEVAMIGRGRIPRLLQTTGRLQSRATVRVTAGIAGQLEVVGVMAGDRVLRQERGATGAHLALTRLSAAQHDVMLAWREEQAGLADPAAPREVPADDPGDELPVGLKGFAGVLTGTVAAAWPGGCRLAVESVASVHGANRAAEPQIAVGRTVRVGARSHRDGAVWTPDARQVDWFRTLQPGQRVSVDASNDLLALFDTEPFRYDVADAESTVRLRREEVSRRELELEKARNDYARAFRTREDDQFDERLFTQEQLDELRLTVDTAMVELRVARLSLEQGQVDLSRARRNLELCFVTAPIDGVIVERLVEPYDRVTAGSELFTMADPDDLELRIHLTEREAATVLAGQRATITARGQSAFSYPATVERIAPAVDTERGLVEVRLRMVPWRTVQAIGMFGRLQQLLRLTSGPAALLPTARLVGRGTLPPLRPGMFVSVTIATAVHERAVLCPKEALMYERDRAYVFRVSENMTAERAWLTLRSDFTTHTMIEVEDGLRPGDRVVIRQSDLKDGAKLKILDR